MQDCLLGEYSALSRNGALDFEMQLPWLLSVVLGKRLHLQALGEMVAVLNTPVEVIEEACETTSKVVESSANHNTQAKLLSVVRWLRLTTQLNSCRKQGKTVDSFKCIWSFPYSLLEPVSQQLAEALESEVS